VSGRRRRQRDRPSGPRPRIRVELTGVAHGGEALGRVDGRVVFVPHGLPGEIVVAEITQDKGDYARAEIVEIERRAPERTVPLCAYAGTCGGCQWQHAEYPAQLGFKRAIVAEQLRRIGGFADAESLVLPTLGMADPWYYRNHARFSVGRRYGEVGFTRAGTRSLLRIDHCRISHPQINAVLERVQRRLPGLSAHQLAVRVGANTGDRLINPALPPLAALGDSAGSPPPRDGAQESSDGHTGSRDEGTGDDSAAPPEHVPAPPHPGVSPDVRAGRADTIELASGQLDLHEELLGRRFRVASATFFQVNTRRELRGPDFPSPATVARFGHLIPEDGLSMAEALVLIGLDRLDPHPEDVVVDAYCGVGTFAALLAPLVRAVIGIEESGAAVKDADLNCADLPNARFVVGKVEHVLPSLAERATPAERPTKVLLDPARVGCEPPVLEALIVAEPERIVYVSCEPATLARDLAILRDGGYTLRSVQPIDMFPQTYHVESVSLLTR